MTNIFIPNTVTSISSMGFANCPNLTITVDKTEIEANTQFSTNWNTGITVVYNKEMSSADTKYFTFTCTTDFYGNNTATITGVASEFAATGEYYSTPTAIKDGETYITDIVIPSQIVENGVTYTVTAIGNSAFDSGWYGNHEGSPANYTSFIIPNTVKTIGDNAFKTGGSIEYVSIPSSVTTIGTNAFAYCPNTTIVIDKTYQECSVWNNWLGNDPKPQVVYKNN